MLPSELARNHQVARERVTAGATVRALRVWRRIDPQRLDMGWAVYGRELTALVAAAQVQAAKQAVPYVDAIGPGPVQIVPEMFSGVMSDGRELEPALFSAVTTTKTLTGRGLSASRSFEVGASYLATLIGSAVQDLGRQADSVAASGKKWTQYVRVLNPGACSRCAVLAGKSSNAVAFPRHPRCRCTAFPLASGTTPAGFFSSGDDYFRSLSAVEQDHVFTRAGAEAIRNGADLNSVVNARRGALTGGSVTVPARLRPVTIGVRADGTPLRVYLTNEGVTARSSFGRRELQLTNSFTKQGRYRRSTTIRLMPEQIQVMAGHDPVRWRELLIRYGYLIE